MIITRTPLRVSLAGGGTDLPSFFEQATGSVVSFTIDKYIYVILNRKFDEGVRVSYSETENVRKPEELRHDIIRETLLYFRTGDGMEIVTVADVSGHGTGLGSSSALAVGLGKAFNPDVRNQALAEFAYEIEHIRCGHPCGKQDMYASACGGLNHFSFGKKMTRVTPIPVPECMQDWLLMLWTGQTRLSGDILKEQSAAMKDDAVKFSFALEMADSARSLRKSLLEGNWYSIGSYLNYGWTLKKHLAENISDSDIDNLYSIAIENGALGGKLLGAGGGGFFLFFADPHYHQKISDATGLKRFDFKITENGSEVIYDDSRN